MYFQFWRKSGDRKSHKGKLIVIGLVASGIALNGIAWMQARAMTLYQKYCDLYL